MKGKEELIKSTIYMVLVFVFILFTLLCVSIYQVHKLKNQQNEIGIHERQVSKPAHQVRW